VEDFNVKTQHDVSVVKLGAGVSGLIASLVLLAAVTALLIPSPARAGFGYFDFPRVSDALEAPGFETLKFALDTTGLTGVLEANRVTLFAPTNEVFEDTAHALGCTDALDLATRLLNTPVDDSNALSAVLANHAVLGVIRSKYKLTTSGPFQAVGGAELATGVNSHGLFVQGVANSGPAAITVEGIAGVRWVIYPIDTILLPFAPPADLCD
jgi:uncharacterized surface protein with fasciclin (FAS1) repeats